MMWYCTRRGLLRANNTDWSEGSNRVNDLRNQVYVSVLFVVVDSCVPWLTYLRRAAKCLYCSLTAVMKKVTSVRSMGSVGLPLFNSFSFRSSGTFSCPTVSCNVKRDIGSGGQSAPRRLPTWYASIILFALFANILAQPSISFFSFIVALLWCNKNTDPSHSMLAFSFRERRSMKASAASFEDVGLGFPGAAEGPGCSAIGMC